MLVVLCVRCDNWRSDQDCWARSWRHIIYIGITSIPFKTPANSAWGLAFLDMENKKHALWIQKYHSKQSSSGQKDFIPDSNIPLKESPAENLEQENLDQE